jgi:nuclear pore complex protein Nup62
VTKTFQAERDAAEVEKQLSNVEGQQDELEQWLDKYEKEVDDMVRKVGLNGDGGGVDLERERTYVLFKPAISLDTDFITGTSSLRSSRTGLMV